MGNATNEITKKLDNMPDMALRAIINSGSNIAPYAMRVLIERHYNEIPLSTILCYCISR